MLRRIKKWYFKIYHLFKLLGIFVLIFGVKEKVFAEEYNACFDKYKIGEVSFEYKSTYWNDILPVLPANEPNTTYYVRFFPNENYTGYNNTYFSTTLTAIHTDGTTSWYYPDGNKVDFDVNNQIISFKTKSNLGNVTGLKVSIYTYNSNYNVLEDSPVIMSTNLDDVMECKNTPAQDSVYSSFLTLYTDKISYLAEGFTKNPYLITMIGIIFSFVVLELFLKILHLKGGYRK